jgi:hypothetical protein
MGLGCASGSPGQLITPVETSPPHNERSSPESQTGSDAWELYWRSRNVSPAPPPDFLEPRRPATPVRWLNLTRDAITDNTAARWILGDMRRAAGDGWASRHMRVDIVNAGVLGPQGLNGDDRFIADEQAKGTVEIQHPEPAGELVAAAVVAIPPDVRRKAPTAELTDFVIVILYRSTGKPSVRVQRDGRRELLAAPHSAGELGWQLDTGKFTDDPLIGPLWYQARGWSCRPDSSVVGQICGLVQPDR